jgi:hypothetical protein
MHLLLAFHDLLFTLILCVCVFVCVCVCDCVCRKVACVDGETLSHTHAHVSKSS